MSVSIVFILKSSQLPKHMEGLFCCQIIFSNNKQRPNTILDLLFFACRVTNTPPRFNLIQFFLIAKKSFRTWKFFDQNSFNQTFFYQNFFDQIFWPNIFSYYLFSIFSCDEQLKQWRFQDISHRFHRSRLFCPPPFQVNIWEEWTLPPSL